MKQGSGSSSRSAGKVEPKSSAVSVEATANIGVRQVYTSGKDPALTKGRGFEAPKPVACTSHKGGSQGKH